MKKIHLKSTVVVLAIFLVLIFTGVFLLFITSPSTTHLTDERLSQEYASLSNAPLTGSCGGLNNPTSELLQGACCGKMSLDRYIKQRRFLEKYNKYAVIPKDPWNISVEDAKKLVQYDKEIVLTQEEQKIYNDAFELFKEGPCCCRCWRWFAFSGLAKHLIQEEGFSAKQIAELWAAEDVCGDENPFEELSNAINKSK